MLSLIRFFDFFVRFWSCSDCVVFFLFFILLIARHW